MSTGESLQIDLSRRDLVEEFHRQPFGRHSPDLRLLLNVLRRNQTNAYILVCTKPQREWKLARKTTERASSIELASGGTFNSPAQAEWHVFKLLWKAATGEEIA